MENFKLQIFCGEKLIKSFILNLNNKHNYFYRHFKKLKFKQNYIF